MDPKLELIRETTRRNVLRDSVGRYHPCEHESPLPLLDEGWDTPEGMRLRVLLERENERAKEKLEKERKVEGERLKAESERKRLERERWAEEERKAYWLPENVKKRGEEKAAEDRAIQNYKRICGEFGMTEGYWDSAAWRRVYRSMNTER
jgi:hypothetical protein